MFAGDAPMVIAIMWAMTALSLLIVILRLVTRIFVVKAVGMDDYVFCLAWFFLLFYTIFLTISADHGFGQDLGVRGIEEAAKAVKMELIGQTFAVLGMAIAKVSLGLFLIRIVVRFWHNLVIWIAMVSLACISIMTAIIIWVQCIPAAAIYDSRVKGTCKVKLTPLGVLLGVWCAIVDFFFAGFPWVFIWGLQMKKKDKLILALSMSLGVIAGAAGIVRTTELAGLGSKNYTKDTVGLIVWSAVEISITMVCIGLPVLRPMYKCVFNKMSSSGSGKWYENQEVSGSHRPGGHRLKDLNNSRTGHGMRDDENVDDGHVDNLFQIKGSTISRSYPTRDNRSDEDILMPDYGQQDIHVTTKIHVERSTL